MKFIFIITLLVATTVANAADVSVVPCPKDPKTLKVQIDGESAINLFRALALRINLRPADMLSTISNGMNCQGIKFSTNGDVVAATCSYLMKDQKNIPYPQIDPGFAHEEVINCE